MQPGALSFALGAGAAAVVAFVHGWAPATSGMAAPRVTRALVRPWGARWPGSCESCGRNLATRRRAVAMHSSAVSSQPARALGLDGCGVTTRQAISAAVQAAMGEAFGPEHVEANSLVTPATKEEFGDYQCNAALSLAKPLKQKPQEIARRLSEALAPRVAGMCAPPEIAGPGFINLRLRADFVASRVDAMLADPERLAVPRTAAPQRVIVDFSSPNIAKEMHVGHLRSTIIGDTLCRVLELRGHDVLRLNHVGDWGTQFGMLIAHLRDVAPGALDDAAPGGTAGGAGSRAGVAIGDLVEFYRKAKQRFDEDAEFKERSRQEVVRLQQGDAENLAAWRTLCEISRQEFQVIYDMLGVHLKERGESFYNPLLADVIGDLGSAGLLEESEGARVVFVDGYMNRDGSRQPLLVQKGDGGYMYSTTDLAALRQRAAVERADRILYVTDVGQSSHFDQVFRVARAASLVPAGVSLEHVPFGLVQGEDGKKFKTRSGDTVRLRDLLDEAVRIAGEDVRRRYEEEGRPVDAEAEHVARVVGIAAVKYADLCMNRESNYRFSYGKMLSLQGNTAPYMLYAYARIQGISRKASDSVDDVSGAPLILEHPSELGLARQIIRLPEVLEELERDLFPNRLCEYIFELSARFNQFYELCPVNGAPTPALRRSRTALCRATAAVLRLSLGLLGIETVERL